MPPDNRLPRYALREPMTMGTLRMLQALNRGNDDVRTLLLEIKRLHGVLADLESMRRDIAYVWLEEIGYNLPALAQMNTVLQNEPAVAPKDDTAGPAANTARS